MKKLLRPMPFLLILTLLCFLFSLLFPFTSKAIFTGGIVLFSLLSAILIHESGHLFVGSLVGLKPEEMIVGPFRLLFTGRSLSLRPNNSWLYFGGIMRFAARSSDLEATARKWCWMSLGGPAASLLTALLLLLSPLSHLWTMCLLLISTAIGGTTLVPYSNGISHSDGRLFLLLRKGSTRATLLIAGVILHKDYLSTRRPAEWNNAVIHTSSQLLDSLQERTPSQLAEESELRMFLYCHFADRGQVERALQYIQPISITSHPSRTIPASRIMIDSLYACHLLLRSPEDPNSRRTAEKIVSTLPKHEPYSYHKAWAACLSLDGNKQKAMDHLIQAKTLLERWFKPFGTYRFEQAILEQIENKL